MTPAHFSNGNEPRVPTRAPIVDHAPTRLESRRRPAMLVGLSALLTAICFSTSPAHATLVEGTFDGFAGGSEYYREILGFPAGTTLMSGSFSYDTDLAVQTAAHVFTFTS